MAIFQLPASLPAGVLSAGGATPSTDSVRVTIAGTAVTLLGMSDNPKISSAIGQRSTASFVVLDAAGTGRYQQGSAVQIYDNSGTLVFGGIVQTDTMTKPTFINVLLHQVQCSDWHYLADKRIIATSYTSVTCGAIVNDIITNWLGAEGVTAGTIQAGPTISGSIAFNYKTASSALDKLATLAGFVWWIDAYKALHFVAQSTLTAPWTFDGTQADDDQSPMSLELTNPLYRNSQWILGIKEVTSSQTEQRKGDGTTRSFTMSYPLHAVPTVTVDSVSKTVGIRGVDTGKDWYWSKGDPVISQDSGGVVLTSANTLQVVYTGEFEVVTYSQNAGAVSTEQTLEGGGSGVVEDVQTDTSLTTATQAFQFASGLLAKYATNGEILTFTTKTPGLQAGQLLSTNVPAPWSMTGQFLIESVDIRFDGMATWWYDAKALAGPVNDTWVNFFTRLATQGSVVDDSSLGTQQSVSILAAFTAAWNWAATFTPTVYACPIIGPTQKCGPTVIIC